MAIDKIQSESINLADNFAFTGSVSGAGVSATPAFNVRNSGTTVSDNVDTKVAFDNEILDTDNTFDSSTNYRFTPAVAGKYFITCTLYSDASAESIIRSIIVTIRKNGTAITGARAITDFRGNNGVGACGTVSTIVTLDTDDYIEIYAYQNSGGNSTINGNSSYPEQDIGTWGAYRIIT